MIVVSLPCYCRVAKRRIPLETMSYPLTIGREWRTWCKPVCVVRFRIGDDPYYFGLRFSGLPIASKKMALFPFAWGEKNSMTSSSKKVSPVAPRCWA